MIRNFIKVICLLALLFSTPTPFANTGHSYAPMTPGTTITYVVYSMTGNYDPATGKISVSSNTYIKDLKITYAAYSQDSYVPAWNLFVSGYHDVGNPPPPLTSFTDTLRDSKWIMPNNFQYIGEMVNQSGQTIIPPEAKMARNPVAGEVLDTTSVVRVSPTDNTVAIPSFHWRYRTIEYLPIWGVFTDCWRTGLREYGSGGAPDMVYNYVFMKDKGLVNFWFGSLSGTSVTGFQYYAIAY